MPTVGSRTLIVTGSDSGGRVSEVVRHRLSLAGNRRLNWALHMIAINQARYKGQGGSYYRKKVAEGKTHREAMRCLKRRVSDAVFKKLMLDLEEAA